MNKSTWIADFIDEMLNHGIDELTAKEEAEYQWDHVGDDCEPRSQAQKIAPSYE